MKGPRLSPKFQVKSFLASGQSLETPVEPHFYNAVKSALVDLLGAQSYFASRVLTPYCYTLGTYYETMLVLKLHSCKFLTPTHVNLLVGISLWLYMPLFSRLYADIEIKLDEEGYVLPASHSDEVHKR